MMVVIGVGSPLLSDDGAGHRVIDLLGSKVGPEIRLVKSSGDSMLIVEELAGCSGAVIIDAIVDNRLRPGEVVCSGIADYPGKPWSSHGGTLSGALAIGRSLGVDLPDEIDLYLVGVVALESANFSETLSREVEEALPDACARVIDCIERIQQRESTVLKPAINLQPLDP